MFFRGRQPEASIWRRFRVSSDGFTFEQTDDLFTAHVVANAERVVDLFYALSEQLPLCWRLVGRDSRDVEIEILGSWILGCNGLCKNLER